MKITQKFLPIVLILTIIFHFTLPALAQQSTSDHRIAGGCRFTTAVEISKEGWPQGSQKVVLTSGLNFPDSLAGAPLAYFNDAPILLTNNNSLHSATQQELQRLKAEKVYILGGPIAVSKEIEDQLKTLGYSVERIAGNNRHETAVSIGNELRKQRQVDSVILTTGDNYPDALAIAPIASRNGSPILFTSGNSLPEPTKKAISDWNVNNITIIGGYYAVPKEVENQLREMGKNVNRIAGNTRYETSLEIAKEYDDGSYTGAIIATGEDFPDALSGSVIAAKSNKPIILVQSNSVESSTLSYINKLQGSLIILGGTNAISDSVVNEIIGNTPNHQNIYFNTYYNVTLEQALDLQMLRGANTNYYNFTVPATREEVEKFLNPTNFTPFNNEPKSQTFTLTVNTNSLRVRQKPTTNSPQLAWVHRNENYTILDRTLAEDGYLWHKINVKDSNGKNIQGWVRGDLVRVSPINSNPYTFESIKITTNILNVRERPTTESSRLGQVRANDVYVVEGKQNGWYKITAQDSEGDNITGWVSGQYVKPTKEVPRDMYQFLVLSGTSGATINDLNRLLNNRGILHNTGQAFIEAGIKHNINEIYLVSHALHETGNGRSKLAQGIIVGTIDGKLYTEYEKDTKLLENPVKVYNMYGIGAHDRDPNNLGAKYAYEQGWDTPEKAIIGGAHWIAIRYVNNPARRQDTLYKMKWNPENPATLQYATDVGWAVKQITTIKNLYDQIDNYLLRFDIPVYYMD